MKLLNIIITGWAVLLNATENSPQSLGAADGKSVYLPIAKPINLHEEADVQKADQNRSGHGSAKWLQKQSR